jgi:hypothetical protein
LCGHGFESASPDRVAHDAMYHLARIRIATGKQLERITAEDCAGLPVRDPRTAQSMHARRGVVARTARDGHHHGSGPAQGRDAPRAAHRRGVGRPTPAGLPAGARSDRRLPARNAAPRWTTGRCPPHPLAGRAVLGRPGTPPSRHRLAPADPRRRHSVEATHRHPGPTAVPAASRGTSLYTDVNQWAYEDPTRWAVWAAPCPVTKADLPRDANTRLAEARGFRVAMTLAHQHLGQLPRELHEGMSTNARSKIFFNASPEDARELSRHTAPRLTDHDLAHLGVYHATARLVLHGEEAQPFTMCTQPMPRAIPGRAREIRTIAHRTQRARSAAPTVTRPSARPASQSTASSRPDDHAARPAARLAAPIRAATPEPASGWRSRRRRQTRPTRSFVDRTGEGTVFEACTIPSLEVRVSHISPLTLRGCFRASGTRVGVAHHL